MALWSADEIAKATGGRAQGNWDVSGISIDTRSIEAGELFVALKDIRDGHDFVGAALEKGAAGALVSYIPEGVDGDAPLIIVDDVLRALEDLGRAARARIKGRVVGVTGSVGKTGTKEMLRSALAPFGSVHAAERSFNNHWGVPLTLARMPRETDFAVIEIGMNAPGEIGPLSRMADLDAAVVTIVAPVHMAAFKDVSEIAHAKAEIFEGLREGGLAILNHDIATYPILHKAARAAKGEICKFGQTEGADCALRMARVADSATVVEARIAGQKTLFKLASPGTHLAMNAMAVLAVIHGFGLDLAQAVLALSAWQVPDGRGKQYRVILKDTHDGWLDLIDESYNANPTSMAAAIEVLVATSPRDGVGRIARGRRVAFLGDMLELGPDEAQMHADIAKIPDLEKVDQVHVAGPLMKSLYDALPDDKRGSYHETAQSLAQGVHDLLDAGDVAMVKGSNGSKIALVAQAIRAMARKDAENGA